MSEVFAVFTLSVFAVLFYGAYDDAAERRHGMFRDGKTTVGERFFYWLGLPLALTCASAVLFWAGTKLFV